MGGTGWDLPVPFTPTGGVGNGGFPGNLVLGEGVPVGTVVVCDGRFPSPDPDALIVPLVAVFRLLAAEPLKVPKAEKSGQDVVAPPSGESGDVSCPSKLRPEVQFV